MAELLVVAVRMLPAETEASDEVSVAWVLANTLVVPEATLVADASRPNWTGR